MKKTKQFPGPSSQCPTCGLVMPLDKYRNGLTGDLEPMPEGGFVCICPQCGCVTEASMKGGQLSQRIMPTSEIMQQCHAAEILAEAIPIGLRFIKAHPEHPAVQKAFAMFKLIQEKLKILEGN